MLDLAKSKREKNHIEKEAETLLETTSDCWLDYESQNNEGDVHQLGDDKKSNLFFGLGYRKAHLKILGERLRFFAFGNCV